MTIYRCIKLLSRIDGGLAFVVGQQYVGAANEIAGDQHLEFADEDGYAHYFDPDSGWFREHFEVADLTTSYRCIKSLSRIDGGAAFIEGQIYEGKANKVGGDVHLEFTDEDGYTHYFYPNFSRLHFEPADLATSAEMEAGQ